MTEENHNEPGEALNTVCANCGVKLYQNTDPNNIHWYHSGTGDVRCPTRFAEPSRAPLAAVRGNYRRQVSELLDAIETDIRLLAEPQPTTTATRLMVAKNYAMGHLAVLRSLFDTAAPSSFPAEPPPCRRCADDANYLPAYYDEQVKAWLHRGRNNEGYLCRLKHPNGFDAPAEPLQPEGEQVMNFSELCHIEHSPPATPSAAAMRAAEEIEPHLNPWWLDRDRLDQVAAIITRNLAATSSPKTPVGGEAPPCWSCGGEAEARDDIHVRCIDSKGINCEVMDHWFTRRTWNSRAPLHAAGDDEGEVCPHCNHRDCECSDMDVSPDMGAKG